MTTDYFCSTLKYLPYVQTLNEIVIAVNKAFIDFTGYTKEEILNYPVSYITGLLRINLTSNLKSIKLEDSYYLFTKSYQPREVNISVQPGESDNEEFLVFIEKPNSRIEEKLPLFTQICTDSLFGVAIYSMPDVVLLKANQAYFNLLHSPFNNKLSTIGKNIKEFTQGLESNSAETIWNTAIDTKISSHSDEYLYTMLERGAIYRNGSLIPIYQDKKLKYVIEIATDITETVLNLNLAEEQSKIIKQQNNQSKVSDDIFMLDKEDNYVKLNRSAREYLSPIKNQHDILYNIIDTFDLPILRLSYPDLTLIEFNKKTLKYTQCLELDIPSFTDKFKLGKTIFEIFPNFKYNHYNYILQLSETKSTVYANTLKFQGENKPIFLNFIYQPILNPKNEILEIILILVDVTKEIEQTKAIEKVLKMQEEFFSFISHEFRTPLTVSLSAIQVLNLIYGKELPEKSKRYIEKIRQSSLQQLRLVNNLLDITRAESGYLKIHKKNVDVVSMTRSIVDSISLYAKEKGLNICFSSSSPFITAALDDEKFERILLNLLSNAIKFTPKDKCIQIDLSIKKGKICIKIKDEGVGIPKEKLSIIFDRFGQVDNSLTRKAEGTGIGLCLVKLLVNKLDGEIFVESEVEKGTTFTIFLPNTQDLETENENLTYDLMDDRLVQSVNIEFSTIYPS